MGKVSEQEVAVLSSKQGLMYLTGNDWALIIDKASRVHLKKGAVLMSAGKNTDGIYLLMKGSALVQMPHRGLRSIGPGEVCGEMSFLEEAPASATVAAEGDLEAYHLDRLTLQGLFELFPHLGSRFYRSVATNLSRRLREMIGPPEAIKKPRD
jgi:CRP/FNR family transcriptional regulator, cyclic AMP receptor protein